MISIAEEILVPSPRGRVWAVISDPAQVVSCINGAELGAAHDDGSFDGTLAVKFGALRVRFGARVQLELVPDEYEGVLSARGKDGQGGTRFTASATFRVLEGASPATSKVVVAGQIELSGKLAGLVEAGAGAVVSRMTREFSAALVARCTESAAASTAAAGASADPGAADQPAAVAVPGAAVPGDAVPGDAAAGGGLWARLRAWWERRRQRRRPEPAAPAAGIAPDAAAPAGAQRAAAQQGAAAPVVPVPEDGSC